MPRKRSDAMSSMARRSSPAVRAGARDMRRYPFLVPRLLDDFKKLASALSNARVHSFPQRVDVYEFTADTQCLGSRFDERSGILQRDSARRNQFDLR